MRIKGNTILITGGATGIGFAMAERFVNSGNRVIICGRRKEKLEEAKRKLPAVHIRQCDISKDRERKALFEWMNENFEGVNVLVNNAGIQRAIDLKKGMEDLEKNEDEIEINLRSQIYLAAIFIPTLLKKKEAAIINVSSGLGLVPLATFPIYCATKAAIHAFSISMRHQLRETSIKVFEIVPPTVYDTELKGKHLEKTDWSVSSSEMADSVMKGLEEDRYEIGAGPSNKWMSASRNELDQIFKSINH